ncbi:hypothetical protein MUP37_01135 [Candidatus Bathyarchaeota archaeon]|nr:hypothetical protein [Candidatus Bathyarchaeota archaeon]
MKSSRRFILVWVVVWIFLMLTMIIVENNVGLNVVFVIGGIGLLGLLWRESLKGVDIMTDPDY